MMNNTTDIHGLEKFADIHVPEDVIDGLRMTLGTNWRNLITHGDLKQVINNHGLNADNFREHDVLDGVTIDVNDAATLKIGEENDGIHDVLGLETHAVETADKWAVEAPDWVYDAEEAAEKGFSFVEAVANNYHAEDAVGLFV